MSNFFGEIEAKRSSNQKSSITDYIFLENDKPIKIQFLSRPKPIYKHWIFTDGRKLPFNCLGPDCPVCQRNLQIMDELGLEEAKKHPQFFNREEKFVSNVLDLTPAKVCPKCSTSNEKAATKCSNQACGNIIIDVDPTPLKAVRYLEGSRKVYKAVQETAEMLPGGEESVQKIPFMIKQYKDNNNQYGYTAIPQVNDPDAVNADDYQDKLFDKFGISVSYEELIILMNGGSFKEIMSSRNSGENKKELDNLFKD